MLKNLNSSRFSNSSLAQVIIIFCVSVVSINCILCSKCYYFSFFASVNNFYVDTSNIPRMVFFSQLVAGSHRNHTQNRITLHVSQTLLRTWINVLWSLSFNHFSSVFLFYSGLVNIFLFGSFVFIGVVMCSWLILESVELKNCVPFLLLSLMIFVHFTFLDCRESVFFLLLHCEIVALHFCIILFHQNMIEVRSHEE